MPTDVKGILHTLKSYLVSSSQKFAIAFLSLASQQLFAKRMDPTVSPKVSTFLSVSLFASEGYAMCVEAFVGGLLDRCMIVEGTVFSELHPNLSFC